MSDNVAFDYDGWQQRMGYSNEQAAQAIDVSVGMFLTLRRNGSGRAVYMWAAYGRECAKYNAQAAV